jgi:hypothetical protein
MKTFPRTCGKSYLSVNSLHGISDTSSLLSFVKSDAFCASEKEELPLWSELSRWLAWMVNAVTENIQIMLIFET